MENNDNDDVDAGSNADILCFKHDGITRLRSMTISHEGTEHMQGKHVCCTHRVLLL